MGDRIVGSLGSGRGVIAAIGATLILSLGSTAPARAAVAAPGLCAAVFWGVDLAQDQGEAVELYYVGAAHWRDPGSEKIFWHMYSQLSADLKRELQYMPTHPTRIGNFATAMAERRALPPVQNFVSSVATRWFEHVTQAETTSQAPGTPLEVIRAWMGWRPRLPAVDYRTWVFEGLASAADMTPEERRLANLIINKQYLQNKAQAAWRSTAIHRPQVSELGRRQVRVHLGGESWLGDRTSRGLVLDVPLDRLRRPAWNPIDHGYIRDNLARFRRGRLAPVDVYRYISVGLDGYFYLTNDNHKAFVDTRERVKVLLPEPVATMSIAQMFDAIGWYQPTVEQQVEFFLGRMTLGELIPAHGRGKLVLIDPSFRFGSE
jgi:hypothetical protein